MLTINAKFPEYNLKAYIPEGDKINDHFTNADVAGKWVVYVFYPADFTFVCPTELEDAAKSYKEFQKLGAEIISVSVDTAYVHKAWHDNSEAIKQVKYPMLADVGGKLCREVGSYIEDEGLSLRATFVVNPEGIVKTIEMHDNSIGRDIDETLRKIEAAQFVHNSKGILVCPAKWKPGQKTLKPGVDLVGKI